MPKRSSLKWGHWANEQSFVNFIHRTARTTWRIETKAPAGVYTEPAYETDQHKCKYYLLLLNKCDVKGLEFVSQQISKFRTFLNSYSTLIGWDISKYLHILIASNVTLISLVYIYMYFTHTLFFFQFCWYSWHKSLYKFSVYYIVVWLNVGCEIT